MTMALGTMSVCLTVLVLNLHHRDAERPVPRWARVLVLRYLAKLLCVRARKPKTMAANLDLTLPDGEDAASGADIKDGLRHVSMRPCNAPLLVDFVFSGEAMLQGVQVPV